MLIEAESFWLSVGPRLSVITYEPGTAKVCWSVRDATVCAQELPPSVCIWSVVASPHESLNPVHDVGKSNCAEIASEFPPTFGVTESGPYV